MKYALTLIFSLYIAFQPTMATKVRPTKNLIVMIPDGASLSVLSAARWLKTYRGEGTTLNVDPYLCGTVTTFSSNAPIGDSAPTTSCFMTGIAQQAGNVSIYPVSDKENDLVKLNPDSAYQPLVTIPEAMQTEQKKAAGLVVTCEFPHATPADCSSHTYNRTDYKSIAPQMAYSNLEVMFGGGTSFVSDDMKMHFKNTGTTLIENDKQAMLNFSGKKVWALYGKKELPYDIDRDTTKLPSLAQMTSKAIEVLQKNKNGFFLMVEGSKIDWAAHANDPIAIMTEFLAFDKAVGVAIEYAGRMGNTTVIILPDHGNSGFSIGRNNMKRSYTKMTLKDLFGSVSNYKHTSEGLEIILKNTHPDSVKTVFKQNTGIDLTNDELNLLLDSKNNKAGNYMEASKSKTMANYITTFMNDRSTFGYTTGGHTGEEVFLAAYHPKGDIPIGNIRNKGINDYLFKVTGLKTSLQKQTAALYAKHTNIFGGMDYKISTEKDKMPTLTVKKGNKTLVITANSSVAILNGKSFDTGSLAVYIDKNYTFYLSEKLAEKINGK